MVVWCMIVVWIRIFKILNEFLSELIRIDCTSSYVLCVIIINDLDTIDLSFFHYTRNVFFTEMEDGIRYPEYTYRVTYFH